MSKFTHLLLLSQKLRKSLLVSCLIHVQSSIFRAPKLPKNLFCWFSRVKLPWTSFWCFRQCQLWSGNHFFCQTLWSRYKKVVLRGFQQMVYGSRRLQGVCSTWWCWGWQECPGECPNMPKTRGWRLSSCLFLPPLRWHKKQSQVSSGDYRMSTLQM